ncbi:BolA family protein [Candidatus Erwinia haradaeae]|uniref:DNA-binding transcriptional regulator BolA n=1 Tax=Candidatus Erwinia haradaeae TaxID=1922217 RepID=A0A451D8B2_9GAMM|nr:BolA/IbaG family iron-sulfur metabolism protein [Candidatus Erwinia haradaeae]VFP82013.1 DNA-binding transcriptional regulator BolA [Candidatus Erwinia haradaeae]
MTYKTIETKLYAEFNPFYLLIKNENHYHQNYSDSGSHFKVIIVSHIFNNKHRIERHRAIYSVLALEIKNSIHSLSLKAYTLIEWNNINNIHLIYENPKCLNYKS